MKFGSAEANLKSSELLWIEEKKMEKDGKR